MHQWYWKKRTLCHFCSKKRKKETSMHREGKCVCVFVWHSKRREGGRKGGSVTRGRRWWGKKERWQMASPINTSVSLASFTPDPSHDLICGPKVLPLLLNLVVWLRENRKTMVGHKYQLRGVMQKSGLINFFFSSTPTWFHVHSYGDWGVSGGWEISKYCDVVSPLETWSPNMIMSKNRGI